MNDGLSNRELNYAAKQWEALEQDNLLMDGLKTHMKEKGIEPTDAPLPPEPEAIAPAVRTATVHQSEAPNAYENVILSLYELRDSLIEIFRKFSHEKGITSSMTTCIRKIEQIVSDLGGAVEPFNPLAEMSGLTDPSNEVNEEAFLANATKVAENTRNVYEMYEISKMVVKIIKDRPAILIQITGKPDGKTFVVNGQIVANTDFTGNEAIDYVRDGSQQMFTVKALRLGKRVDVSSDYTIRYKEMEVPTV